MICDISTSQDRYVTGPNDSRENPLGDGAGMLHDWMFDLATDDLVRSVLVSVEGQTTVAYFPQEEADGACACVVGHEKCDQHPDRYRR